MLSPRLMPTIMVIMDTDSPTTGTVMAWPTMVTVMVVMLTRMVLTDTTTARGPLMLSPLLTHFMVPMVIPVTMVWATTVWVTEVMLDTLTATTDTTDTES